MTETFGQYKLTKRLASGGMAEVYLAAVHGVAGFTKPVVIKRLHPRLSEDQDFVQMLIDEARITSQLTHTNICQVLDLGSVDTSYFIAMEYLAGDDLSTLQEFCRRKKKRLPAEAIVYILAEVLAGLDFAHRKEGPDGQPLGIIHRDISPQNIIVTYEGEVKIIDFGIAKARLRLVHTQAGVIKGKFRYMSPEQAMGGMIDHRTDVFAAGVVLYELLRGAPHSVELSNTEVLERIRKAEFEPLKRCRPDIPPELDSIVKKALKRKKEHRFSGANEFRAVLLKFLQQRDMAFGRSELARIMRQVFDEDRRRERSGSFAGPMNHPPNSGPVAPIPALANSIQRDSTSILDEEEQTPAYVSSGELPDPASVALQPRPTRAATARIKGQDPADSGQHTAPRTIPFSEGAPAESKMEFEATLSVDEQAITNQRRQQADANEPPEDEAQTQAFFRQQQAGNITAPDTLEQEDPEPMTQVREPAAAHQTIAATRAPPPSVQPAPQRRPSDARSRSVLHGPSIIQQPGHQAADSFQKPTNSLDFFKEKAAMGEVSEISSSQDTTDTQPALQPRPIISAGALVVLLLFVCGAAAFGLYLKNGSLFLFALAAPDHGVPDSAPALAAPIVDAAVAAEDHPSRVRRPRSRVAFKVQSNPPGARIHFCGRSLTKTTPVTLRAKAGKTCTLTLTLEGYVTYQEEITPRRGMRGIQASLEGRADTHEKMMGTLRITSIQVGTVFIDGQPRGTTPLLILSLPSRTYSVSVHFKALNVRTPRRRITISSGRTKAVHFDPSP